MPACVVALVTRKNMILLSDVVRVDVGGLSQAGLAGVASAGVARRSESRVACSGLTWQLTLSLMDHDAVRPA